MKSLKTLRTRSLISFLLILLFSAISCIGSTTLVDAHGFSNLVLDKDVLWVGAGYKLYKIDLNQKIANLVYDTEGVVISFVQIDGKRIFFGGNPSPSGRKSVVWSLDIVSQNIAWKHEFDINSSGGVIVTPPIVGNDTFLIGFRQTLYALDKFNGEEKWKIEKHWFGTGELLTPILFDEQLIYGPYSIDEHGPQTDHTVAFANPSSGEIFRKFSMPGRLGAIPAIHGNCLFIKDEIDSTRNDLRLNCIDIKSGKIIWSTGGDGYPELSHLGFYDGWVFDIFADQLFAMDERSGTIYWKSPSLDETIKNPQVIKELNSVALETPDSNQVVFLDLETGELKNEKLLSVLSSPLFIGQEAIYGTTNAIVCVDIMTGNIIWSIPVDSQYQDVLSED